MSIPSYYLPKEAVNYVNFPALREVQPDIERLMAYSLRVDTALVEYDSGQTNRVDVNAEELREYIALARHICYVLGTAESIAFDILYDIRRIQMMLQNLAYLRREHGSRYVGTPTRVAGSEVV